MSADKKAADEHLKHIDNVMATRRRLGLNSNFELLDMNYRHELKKTKR
jgi:hypothetical protein